jgi:hypothetical protein
MTSPAVPKTTCSTPLKHTSGGRYLVVIVVRRIGVRLYAEPVQMHLSAERECHEDPLDPLQCARRNECSSSTKTKTTRQWGAKGKDVLRDRIWTCADFKCTRLSYAKVQMIV